MPAKWFAHILGCVSTVVALKPMHEFKHVDFDWSEFPFTREQALKNGDYIPEHVTITGIKQWKRTLYVTCPRWLRGVPSTLNTVEKKDGKSILKPFPTYRQQEPGIYHRLQHVQSMEIDRHHRIWIIDAGRLNMFEKDAADFRGPPKIWIWDIESHVLLHEHILPQEVVSYTSGFLNDVFVDDVRQMAYISDASGTGAIIVYDWHGDRSRRWESHRSLRAETPLPPFTIEGLDINKLGPLPVDGLALDPATDRVFYTPIHGLKLWSVSAAALRDYLYHSETTEQVDATVKDHGNKSSQCDGLTASSDGKLFMTMLRSNSIAMVNTRDLVAGMGTDVASHEQIVVRDDRLWWPDTFGWASDEQGGLLVTSARLEQLFLGDWPANRVNVAIFRVPTTSHSYLKALGKLRHEEL